MFQYCTIQATVASSPIPDHSKNASNDLAFDALVLTLFILFILACRWMVRYETHQQESLEQQRQQLERMWKLHYKSKH